MAFKFKLPDVGEGMAEGEIVKWLVAEGDTVEEEDSIVEIQKRQICRRNCNTRFRYNQENYGRRRNCSNSWASYC